MRAHAVHAAAAAAAQTARDLGGGKARVTLAPGRCPSRVVLLGFETREVLFYPRPFGLVLVLPRARMQQIDERPQGVANKQVQKQGHRTWRRPLL